MDDLLDRRTLTFEQAEGVEPLPSQLQLREISPELRARLWALIHEELRSATRSSSAGGFEPWLDGAWLEILRNKHVFKDHKFVDDFQSSAAAQIREVGEIIKRGDYIAVLGFLQFVVRHRECPRHFGASVRAALETSRAAYRLEGNTIVPVGSDVEAEAIGKAFAVLRAAEFNGAQTHLRNAAEQLNQGDWARAVAESMNAVESVVRLLTDAGTLSEAIKKLDRTKTIHGSLKIGLDKLYGYTSDEQGVRHSLLEQDGVNVDETDALFMFGACAAMVTYMLGKARAANLI